MDRKHPADLREVDRKHPADLREIDRGPLVDPREMDSWYPVDPLRHIARRPWMHVSPLHWQPTLFLHSVAVRVSPFALPRSPTLLVVSD